MRMRKLFLERDDPFRYNFLILTVKLYPHLLEMNIAVNQCMDYLMLKLMRSGGRK